MPWRLAKALMPLPLDRRPQQENNVLVIQYEGDATHLAACEYLGDFTRECDWSFSGHAQCSQSSAALRPAALRWSQPGPEGAFAGDGRHGSIIPNPGRVRSRNDMRSLIKTTGARVECQTLAAIFTRQ
jgi:hypothetical protein